MGAQKARQKKVYQSPGNWHVAESPSPFWGSSVSPALGALRSAANASDNLLVTYSLPTNATASYSAATLSRTT